MAVTLKELTDLAKFMIEQIATRPENTESGEVNWDYVADDVRIEFGSKFTDDDINYAIGMIVEASFKVSKDEFYEEKIPADVTIH